MRFDDRVTGNLDVFGVNAQVIHVEIDPSEIDKNVKTSVAINAETGEVLTLLARDPELTFKPGSAGSSRSTATAVKSLPPSSRRSRAGSAGKASCS
jgi:thiamine pyrophosphate-dependent acetolactate synthase large subunit-like protein